MIFALLAIVFGANEAQAVMGACGNRPLPSDKVRRVRNIHLECGSGVDHYIRTATNFDYSMWSKLEKLGSRDEMQKLRQNEPVPQWRGVIPYATIEVWDWTDWVYGAHPVCGYDRVCSETCSTDSEGRRSCHETCHDVMRSCWHDEDRHEERHCSNESVLYEAHFVRPPLSQWNPKTPGYYDVIPNKYDLLPAEVEDVQIFNNNRQSTTMSAVTEVGDAWNEYRFSMVYEETGGSRAECRFNHTYKMKVAIHTEKRINDKQTPNAFRIPVDRFGKPIDPLAWTEAANSKNQTVRTEPDQIRLTDASTTLITAMARQTRKFDAERIEAKMESGQGRNAKPEDVEEIQKKSGFWKNTKVRVRLFQDVKWGRDIRWTHNLYTSGSEVADDDQYRINLHGNDTGHDLYRASGPFSDGIWNGLSVTLRPDKTYRLLVSMFQEGVPFYKQEGKWSSENSYYSKELPLEFKTDAHYDARSMWQKFINFQGEKW
jgi:hypothetical protein